MNPEELVARTAAYIKEKFTGEGSGHDWWHIYRVWQNALYLARHEPADLLLVQLGALLHDVADWKFHDGDEKAGEVAARNWLESLNASDDIIAGVCQIIKEVTFKGAGVATHATSIEAKVVQDADRLDAIGAIGIARAFAYGGFKHREMYNPEEPPVQHENFAAYQKNTSHTINHFYEKLLLLRDRMQTPTGRKLAEERHDYMQNFLDQFYREWQIAGNNGDFTKN